MKSCFSCRVVYIAMKYVSRNYPFVVSLVIEQGWKFVNHIWSKSSNSVLSPSEKKINMIEIWGSIEYICILNRKLLTAQQFVIQLMDSYVWILHGTIFLSIKVFAEFELFWVVLESPMDQLKSNDSHSWDISMHMLMTNNHQSCVLKFTKKNHELTINVDCRMQTFIISAIILEIAL